MPRTVLLNPGPVNVTDKVRQALMLPDLCHREKEFSDLMAAIRAKLLKAFDIEEHYTSVLVSGSGTAALEMAVSSSLSPERSMLVIENGVYGERIGKLCDIYQFKRHTLKLGWGELPNLEKIENILKQNPDIEVVSLVHHETTTGLLNPLKEVGELARRYKKIFLVDAISSLAGDEVDFESCPIDIVVGTANKCLQGFPGVSFVLFKKNELDRLRNIPQRTLYFNMVGYHKAQEAGGLLFTPAIPAHYALDVALDELIEETVAGRVQRYAKAAQFLRRGFHDMSLEFLIPEGWRSNCLTSLRLPKGMDYDRLHSALKENGFVIYAGQGNLSDTIFRVANMGDITDEEFKRFLKVLKTLC
ncbi:MAG: 2-aminoethylphosphonate aminotransferase [Nitrospinaceae bacterium]|nr:2-aminoethylphosphonate aminotransferase [Nitrospinaceae bacterium]MBT5868514.1 2-aminoethylphosphonate aminotransferase [Nitrospinaceae bacterium]MBT6346674.1 2-aminoethylphosphonate aminotransferase [Nitrospina sp.]